MKPYKSRYQPRGNAHARHFPASPGVFRATARADATVEAISENPRRSPQNYLLGNVLPCEVTIGSISVHRRCISTMWVDRLPRRIQDASRVRREGTQRTTRVRGIRSSLSRRGFFLVKFRISLRFAGKWKSNEFRWLLGVGELVPQKVVENRRSPKA